MPLQYVNYSLSLHFCKFKSNKKTFPESVPTATHPSNRFRLPRWQAVVLMKQQLVTLSITSTRWMIREPCTENMKIRPPIGEHCTPITKMHELTPGTFTSVTQVINVFADLKSAIKKRNYVIFKNTAENIIRSKKHTYANGCQTYNWLLCCPFSWRIFQCLAPQPPSWTGHFWWLHRWTPRTHFPLHNL